MAEFLLKVPHDKYLPEEAEKLIRLGFKFGELEPVSLQSGLTPHYRRLDKEHRPTVELNSLQELLHFMETYAEDFSKNGRSKAAVFRIVTGDNPYRIYLADPAVTAYDPESYTDPDC